MRSYLDQLLLEAGAVELCWLHDGQMERAWYDDADKLRADCQGPIRHWLNSGNLFTTLNRLDVDAVLEHAEGHPNRRTRDCHVTRYCRLFFDFDSVRPTGQAATGAEVEEARLRAEGLMRRLRLMGWPIPAQAISGNGYHLQYRVALPNDTETKEQLRAIYRGLTDELSDDVVLFDPAVRNPARLCTLYGSWKRKGPSTVERPWRQSSVRIPSDWRQVTRQQVAALAEFYARRPTVHSGQSRTRVSGKGDYSTLRVVAWFLDHDHYQFHAGGNVHRVLCPWFEEHTDRVDSGTVVFERDGNGTGWPGFHCHHSHCQGRDIRDVIALWGDADNYCTAEYQHGAS